MADGPALANLWPPPHVNVTLVVGCDGCGSAGLAEALGMLRGAVLPQTTLTAAELFVDIAAIATWLFSTEDRVSGAVRVVPGILRLPPARNGSAMMIDGSRSSLAAPFRSCADPCNACRPLHVYHHHCAIRPARVVLWRELTALPVHQADEQTASLGALLTPYLHLATLLPRRAQRWRR